MVAVVPVPPCDRCGVQPVWKALKMVRDEISGATVSQLQHYCNHCAPAKVRAFLLKRGLSR